MNIDRVLREIESAEIRSNNGEFKQLKLTLIDGSNDPILIAISFDELFNTNQLLEAI